jgi:hypothetical protein
LDFHGLWRHGLSGSRAFNWGWVVWLLRDELPEHERNYVGVK